MTKLGEAIALAADVHRNQMDKAGTPYILHPLAVMQRATDYYLTNSDGWQIEAVQITAVLHDALEDIDPTHTWTRGRLESRIAEFGSDVFSAVLDLTKLPRNAETYDQYLSRVEESWIARIVKIADLSHNLDAMRIPSGTISGTDFDRWDKYHRAFVRLVKFENQVKG